MTLFSVSRLVPRKNIHVLIAAVEQLVEGRRAADPRSSPARVPRKSGSASSRRGCRASVQFIGFIDEARKRQLLSEADVFVQLSIREGLSIATLEALASGVPCVVSNLPGVREPITPGRRAGTSTTQRTCRVWSRRCGRSWPSGIGSQR